MILLPVVDRELRIRARRQGTYWLRIMAALAFITICAAELRRPFQVPPEVVAQGLFQGLTTIAFGFSLLAGLFVTSDCISEERREGTLGLLFLTDLRIYDVVLGKLIASSLTAMYCLLALLPVMALPVLLGGIGATEYWRVAATVANVLFFSLTAGMFVSCFNRDHHKAMIATALLVMGMAGIVPGLGLLLFTPFRNPGATPNALFLCISPAYSCYLAFENQFRLNPRHFYYAFSFVHAMGWFFLAGVMARIAVLRRETPSESPQPPGRWRLLLVKRDARARAKLLASNPVYYFASRSRWLHIFMWCLVTLVACNVFWLGYGDQTNPTWVYFRYYFSISVVYLNRIWLTSIACRFMIEARRTGLIELLLVTPMSSWRILAGQYRALLRLYFWPIVAIFLLHLFYLEAPVRALPSQTSQVLSGFFGFLADVVALTLAGLWWSLSLRRAGLAVVVTFGIVVVVPWIIFNYVPLQIMATLANPATAHYLPVKLRLFLVTHATLLTSWPGVVIIKDIFISSWALWNLHRKFRAAAAQTHRRDWSRIVKWVKRVPNSPRSLRDH